MSLREYLWNLLIEEKETLEELLRIDNQIGHTSLTYFELLGKIQYAFPIERKLDGRFYLLADGDPDTTFQALITYGSRILTVHVRSCFLGVNKWFVERTKRYYEEQGISIALSLEEREDYASYDLLDKPIVIYGFPEFVEGTKALFEDKNVIAITK